MGRYETISYSRIVKFDSGKIDCDHPFITIKKKTTDELISEMISPQTDKPSFRDFFPSIQISDRQKIDVYKFKCTGYGPVSGKITPFTYSGDDMILLPDGRLMDVYLENIVVFLSRADPNAKPTPSFDCGQAKTSTETAICKSIELSSYDRAIAKTYNETKSFIEKDIKFNGVLADVDKDHLAALQKLQQEEIQKRNTCGDDSKCLLDAMRHNAEVLAEFVRQSR